MPKLKIKSKYKKYKESSKKSQGSSIDLKERLAEKRKAEEARQKMINFIVVCIFLGLLFGVPLGFLVEPKLGIGFFMGISVMLFSWQYPRPALWLFLIYMPFSGTVTYWVGGGNALFQLAKDSIYIPALIALVAECRRKKLPIIVPKKLIPTFSVLLVFVILTLFSVNGIQEFLPQCNAALYSARIACKDGLPFFQGILGLKVLLGYVPLIFCAYYLIEDKKKLLFLGRLLVVLAIICCLLGLLQYWKLRTGSCIGTRGAVGDALFKASLQAKCLVGGSLLYSPEQGVIRLPGTFVSPWHWAWFLIANSALCFTTAFSDRSFFWRVVGLVGMGLVFINAVICGQRIALGLVPVVILTLLILTGQITNFKRFIPIGAGLGLLLGIWIVSNPTVVQQRVDSFVGRWNASPPQAFIESQFKYSINKQRGIFGRGLGKATNSTRSLGKTALIETYHPKLLYEIGYPGLLAFLIFVTHLTILSYRNYRSVRDPTLRNFASSFWVFILIISFFPYWYPLDTDPVAVYYWFLAGVVFKLPIIDQQERQKQQLLVEKEQNGSKTKKPRFKKFRTRKLGAL